MAEVAGKIALLAGARYVETLVLCATRARYVETFTFEGASNFVLARLTNAWHTTYCCGQTASIRSGSELMAPPERRHGQLSGQTKEDTL